MNNMQKTDNKITTYAERSLHLSMKTHFCPDTSCHEVKLGRFVADACDGKTIFEIQTGNLKPLIKKLNYYIENTEYNVVVVRPLAKNRRLIWLDEDSGELKKAARLSPKHESLSSGISELYYVLDFLENERVSFCFPLMEIDEVRLLDGYGKAKKIRATSVNRLAGEIYSMEYVNSLCDVERAILPLLPDEPFTRETLSKALKLNGLKLWSAQKLLLETGLLSSEKDGKRLIFKKRQSY